jgi:hypothetical protein
MFRHRGCHPQETSLRMAPRVETRGRSVLVVNCILLRALIGWCVNWYTDVTIFHRSAACFGSRCPQANNFLETNVVATQFHLKRHNIDSTKIDSLCLGMNFLYALSVIGGSSLSLILCSPCVLSFCHVEVVHTTKECLQ